MSLLAISPITSHKVLLKKLPTQNWHNQILRKAKPNYLHFLSFDAFLFGFCRILQTFQTFYHFALVRANSAFAQIQITRALTRSLLTSMLLPIWSWFTQFIIFDVLFQLTKNTASILLTLHHYIIIKEVLFNENDSFDLQGLV